MKKATLSATLQNIPKVANLNDLEKVLQYFKTYSGTSLDAALSTGILRNSITYYIRDLVEAGLLKSIGIFKDRNTGYSANYYSADKAKWKPIKYKQLSLFEDYE